MDIFNSSGEGWQFTAEITTQILAVVNTTPDSFSDGGQFYNSSDISAHNSIDMDTVLEYCRKAITDGASIIDVGGESTRPGAARIKEDEEIARVLPVVEALADSCTVSVDTMRATVAERALHEGATIINDVSGGLADPRMSRVLSEHPQSTWIISHWAPWEKNDPCASMREHFDSLIDSALNQGVLEKQIVLDPGLGFAKEPHDNWEILRSLDTIQQWGYPLVIGASRKRFLAPYGKEPSQRDIATAIVTALIARHNVWGVRAHNVQLTAMALDIARQLHPILSSGSFNTFTDVD